MRPTRVLPLLLAGAATAAVLALAGCGERATATAAEASGTERPVQAVQTLVAALREDDLDRFARAALPPGLHARVETAWGEGRSRWPLEELPLEAQWPRMLAALSAEDATTTLGAAFDRQFAGADDEIRAAAGTLGLFGMQYVQNDASYSEAERAHYGQMVAALGRWAGTAPLGDRDRGHAALARLATAARATGLGDTAAFAPLGMGPSLAALGGFLDVLKSVLAGYGLDLDATFAGLEARLETQTGDTARVRVTYSLAGTPVDALIELERHDGHWYVGHLLRHAAASAAAPAPAGATGAGAAPAAAR